MNTVKYVKDSNIYKSLIEDADTFLPVIEHPLDKTNLSVKLNEFQYYIHNMGYWLIQYDRQISELDYSIKFLRNFDYSKFNNDSNPNRINHLDYTISNYYIRLSSVLDKSLQLINAVFHLGISDYTVNRSIISNKFVNRTEVVEAYHKIEKVVSDGKQIRNSTIHRDFYTDKQLHKLRFFYSQEEDIEVFEDKWLNEFRKNRLNDYLNKIESNFNKKFKELISVITNFLDELYSIYVMKKKEFNARGFGPIV